MKDVVIIPTYNERKNIRNLLRVISSVSPTIHILVADDSSPDGTAQEVEEAKKRIPNLELLLRPKKEGLGKAYIDAFKRVLTDPDVRSICMMDADFSYAAPYLSEMLNKIDKFDVVIGSRYVKGGANNYPFGRRIMSRLANLYCKIMIHSPVRDCTCGFMCIRTPLLRKIDLDGMTSSGFAFIVELKYLLSRKKASFKEIPFVLENRKEGESKITTGIIFEEIFTPWRLIFRTSVGRLKNSFITIKDVFKKRGILFVVLRGPEVFYKTYVRRNKKLFIFRNKWYNYFCHIYNCTCLNERAVEVSIVRGFIEQYQGKRILEVGNVLSHYSPVFHDVLDKYEKAEGVINQDVIHFKPFHKYDLIVSISTLEHVGWDETQKDPEKILLAIDNLKKCLNPGGKMIVTMGLGYNPEMDRMLQEGRIKFDEQYFLKRISSSNEWKEVKKQELKGIGYNYSVFSAQGLAIGIINN